MIKDKIILVVDDSRAARQLIKSKLVEVGYQVLEAGSGQEALEIIRTQAVHLISMDLEMPDLNGFETCAAIRKIEQELKSPSIPVIIMTGHDTVEGRQKGFAAGATNFLSKSNHGVELLLGIKKILEPNKRFENMGVLVVDDTQIIRTIMTSILKEMGIRVFAASDGLEALNTFREHSKNIDMILTDLDMPNMTGEELCKKVRNELSYKSIPIVIVTGTEDQSKQLQLFSAGATEYIRKPFMKEELVARLSVHLEKILLEKELKSAVAELKDAGELKDKFLSVCSHDLRSPLNGILGCADLLLDSEAVTKEDKKLVTALKNSGQDLLNLISDLLDLSKMKQNDDSIKLTKICPSEILKSCVQQQQSIAQKKQIDFKVTLGGPEIQLMADASSLKRMINNLISNAIKFTPRGGAVSFDATVLSDQIILGVKDSGIGIAKDKLASVFDSYTKQGRAGTEGEVSTGLGLSIVKKLVELHSGSISVESEVGKGTQFTVALKRVAS